jgi:hypothetical protein
MLPLTNGLMTNELLVISPLGAIKKIIGCYKACILNIPNICAIERDLTVYQILNFA